MTIHLYQPFCATALYKGDRLDEQDTMMAGWETDRRLGSGHTKDPLQTLRVK